MLTRRHSIGGLFAARVLADHFARVVVVEPEAWALSDEAADGATSTGTRDVRTDSGAYATIAHKRSRVYQYTAIHGKPGLACWPVLTRAQCTRSCSRASCAPSSPASTTPPPPAASCAFLAARPAAH